MIMEIEPIGVIHSPYKTPAEPPIQASRSDAVGEIELYPEYVNGLKDLDGFSHIVILYRFHKSDHYSLHATPFLDPEPRGIFAIRSPHRPNHIGLSVVKLLGIEGNRLKIQNLDVIDGTPLIDIKPYVPKFDERKNARFGWLEKYL